MMPGRIAGRVMRQSVDQHDVDREAQGDAGHGDWSEQHSADQGFAAEPVARQADARGDTQQQAASDSGDAEPQAGPDRGAEAGGQGRVPGECIGVRREQDQLFVEHAEVEGEHQRHADQRDAESHQQR
jgi:hypothetical protein